MRTRLQNQLKNLPPRISTPTVQDAPQFPSDTLSVSFDGHPTVQAKLQILEPLASGGQGEVLDAKLLFFETDISSGQQKREFPCVVKHLFTLSDPHTPVEFKMQQALTRAHPSAESGLLRIMGVHTVTDEDGRIHKYAIMPKCDAILSDCLPAIRRLDENEHTRPVFYHVIMNVLRSITRGLQNLSLHGVAHRDHKLENIGLHNGTWCMLDFGLARSYRDLVNKKKPKTEGMFVGTPHYISPETINDESNYPFEGDVWALGQIFRKLRGKSFSHQHDENGEELRPYDHLYRKVVVYKEERNKEQRRSVDGTSAFDNVNYQLELQNNIFQTDNFEDCLDAIVNAMCDIFPERRLNLETLQKACAHLESLLPALSSDHQLDKFYHQITQREEAKETEETEEMEIDMPRKLDNTASFHHSNSQRFFAKTNASSSSELENNTVYSQGVGPCVAETI